MLYVSVQVDVVCLLLFRFRGGREARPSIQSSRTACVVCCPRRPKSKQTQISKNPKAPIMQANMINGPSKEGIYDTPTCLVNTEVHQLTRRVGESKRLSQNHLKESLASHSKLNLHRIFKVECGLMTETLTVFFDVRVSSLRIFSSSHFIFPFSMCK